MTPPEIHMYNFGETPITSRDRIEQQLIWMMSQKHYFQTNHSFLHIFHGKKQVSDETHKFKGILLLMATL